MSPTHRNRLKLLGIAAVAVAPILGSYLLYWFWLPGQQMNYGTLVQPRPLPELSLQLVDGTAFSTRQLRGRWTLLVTGSGACTDTCEQDLWKMRQVRLALGKDMGRIERVWLIDDDVAPHERLRKEFAGTWMARARAADVAAVLASDPGAQHHIHLVDPLGNVMLRFPAAPDPRAMIKDLGRLLKYSRTG